MGFSISGSAAVIFLGLFVTAGMVYTTVSNGFEQVSETRAESTDELLNRQNADINVTNATYDGDDTLHVYIENTGGTELRINSTDLLADNEYLEPVDKNEIESTNNDKTNVWAPGETLHIRFTYSNPPASDPSRVKVITAEGIADTATVEVS
ncbi:MAG: hypothetical protein SVG88_06645 [Halobacteriales archaeon]|nr:hypothetical protein [Halobacteriales archaeon]